MRLGTTAIVAEADCFHHGEALQIFQAALDDPSVKTVVLDFSSVSDATTSAFARLVLLRRALRREGRDLLVKNLRHRAADLFKIIGLDAVLPLA